MAMIVMCSEARKKDGSGQGMEGAFPWLPRTTVGTVLG